MLRSVLRHAFLAAGILVGSHAAFAENRVALVIGQSNYHSVVALPNPANDARAMSRLLGDAGFDVTSAADLSQNEMREKVSDFAAKVAAKGPDTVALVFYAGHGLQIDGENFLVPIDARIERESDVAEIGVSYVLQFRQVAVRENPDHRPRREVFAVERFDFVRAASGIEPHI